MKMPSLEEKLDLAKKKKQQPLLRGPNGQLASTSKEAIGKLSQKAGVAPPLTPGGGVALGADPDQAKMIGTAKQKAAALNIAQDPTQQLATAERRETFQRQRTGEEQKKIEKSENLKQMQQLGDRVHSLIQSQFSTPEVEDMAGTGLQLREDSGLEEAAVTGLQQFASGDMAGLAAYNQARGVSPDTPVAWEEISGFFTNSEEAIASAVAQGITDQVMVDQAMIEDLGVDVANLGFDPSNMTLQQFQEEIQSQLDQEFSQIEELEEVSNDPNRSSAERAEARRQLRQLGAVGIRSTESDIEELEEAIATADQMEFAGETYSVEELLDDENVSGIVKRFYEDEEFAKSLREDNEAFADFLEMTRGTLETASSELEGKAVEFSQIQESNKALAATEFGELPSAMMKSLFPEWGSGSLDRFDIETAPALKVFKNPGDYPNIDTNELYNALTELSDLDPSMATQLAKLPPDKLSRLGIGKQGSIWQGYQERIEKRQLLDNIPPNDYNTIAESFFGMDVSALQSNYKKEIGKRSLGLPNNVELYSKLIDPKGSGNLNLSNMHNNLQNFLNIPEPSRLANSRDTSKNAFRTIPKGELGVMPDGLMETAFHELGAGAFADNRIDLKEVQNSKIWDNPDVMHAMAKNHPDPDVARALGERFLELGEASRNEKRNKERIASKAAIQDLEFGTPEANAALKKHFNRYPEDDPEVLFKDLNIDTSLGNTDTASVTLGKDSPSEGTKDFGPQKKNDISSFGINLGE